MKRYTSPRASFRTYRDEEVTITDGKVVDHAARVPLGKNRRVLGVLLGQDNGTTINVANSYVDISLLQEEGISDDSFAVPFEEDERDPKTFFLDLDYVEEMWRMFRKVNGTPLFLFIRCTS